jgi:hypothetical protein
VPSRELRAPRLAYSSAFSLPAIPLWPGTHRRVMVLFLPVIELPQLMIALASACPGPSASDAHRCSADCASAKMV